MPSTPKLDEPGQFLMPDDLYVLERQPKLAEKGAPADGHRVWPVIGPGSVFLMCGMSTVSIEQDPQTTNRRRQSGPSASVLHVPGAADSGNNTSHHLQTSDHNYHPVGGKFG